ncbi:MAG: DUF192 domain-containing protein [Acidimicrobiia bacterium]
MPVEISATQLDVLIADSPEERQVGLKDAEEIPGGADGMLFVYETPAPVRYVMLDVPIPLDIWFFEQNGALIGSAEMAPCPAEPCPLYASPGDVSWVLETPAGVYEFEDGALLSGAPNGANG